MLTGATGATGAPSEFLNFLLMELSEAARLKTGTPDVMTGKKRTT